MFQFVSAQPSPRVSGARAPVRGFKEGVGGGLNLLLANSTRPCQKDNVAVPYAGQSISLNWTLRILMTWRTGSGEGEEEKGEGEGGGKEGDETDESVKHSELRNDPLLI